MTRGWVNNETMTWLSFLAQVFFFCQNCQPFTSYFNLCLSLSQKHLGKFKPPNLVLSLPHAWIFLQAVWEKKSQLAHASHLQTFICCKAGALLVWNNHILCADTPKSYKTCSLAFVHFLSPSSEGEASINTPFVPFLLNVTIINSYWRLHAPPLFFWSLRSPHVKGKVFTKYWDKYTSRVALCAIENVANKLLLPINLFVPSDRLQFFSHEQNKTFILKETVHSKMNILSPILLTLLSFESWLTSSTYSNILDHI